MIPSASPEGVGPVRRWLWCGFAAGGLLGLIEATERAITLRPFLPGAFEPAGLWVVVLGFVLLVGVAAGTVAAAIAAAARLLAGQPGARGVAGRALVGLVTGALAAGWLLLALTLTMRFDRILDRGALLVAGAALAGALAAPLLAWVSRRVFAHAGRGPALAGGGALIAALPVLYAVNMLFAPQSSVGVHVVLDTATVFAGIFAFRLLDPAHGRIRLARSWLALALLLGAAHLVLDASPRIASLAKTRGSTSRRAIQATAWLLDFDRDGFAPRWLTAGWDTAPFDPREPRRWLRLNPSRAGGPSVGEGPVAGGADSATAAPPRIRRLLLITIDALRADAARGGRTTPLGALRPPTPSLDSLAAHSATFTAAYSPSSGTGDTFASLFADASLPGLLGHARRLDWLPRRLADAGYRPFAFVDYPFARSAWGWPHIDTRPGGDPTMAQDAIDALMSDDAPAVVWVHWMPLHAQVLSPLSPQAYFAGSQRRRYADGLTDVDALLGRMLGRLRASGRADSTLVVLSADHGEELGEHGHYHHNLSLYEPAVRVPLWISGPGVVPGERPDVVPQRDLVPTLLEAAGLDTGGSPSRSLWPVLTDPSHRMPRSPIYLFLPQRGFSQKHSPIRAERGQAALVDAAAGRKVIFDLGRERIEAYDLLADPLERVNLAGTDLRWVSAMATALDSALIANARPPKRAAAVPAATP